MKRLSLFGLAIILTWANPGSAADLPPEVKDDLLRTLAAYPKPLREAILEVAGQPDLLKSFDPKSILGVLKVLANQPEKMRNAVEVLATNPEIIELLLDDVDHYLGIALEFAKDRGKLVALLEQLEKDDSQAADDWALRLEENQEALSQLLKAAADFATQPGGNVVDAAFNAVKGAPEVSVYTLPTPGFVEYILTNADQYPDLSDTMVSQWLSSTNPAAYDSGFLDWWGRHANHFHDSLLEKNPERHHRLAELARFNRQHSKVEASKRYERLHEHAKDYPHLAKLPKPDPKRKPVVHHTKPRHHRDVHAAGKDPHRKPHTGRHTKVHRKPPMRHHHVHHAKAAHRHHANHHHHGGKGRGKGKR